MADIDARGREDVKESVQPSESFVRQPSGEHPHSVRSEYGEFSHALFDANYDHSPYASFNAGGVSGGSGGGVVIPKFIHPFMLESFLDPETSISYTKIYQGDVYVKINTFSLGIQEITTSVESYHATNNHASVTTGDESAHTHSAGSLRIPEHQHEFDVAIPSGGEHTTHTGATNSAVIGGSGYAGSDHAHTIGSSLTGGAHTHTATDLITGDINDKDDNEDVEGSTGAPQSSHNHPAPLLESATTTTKIGCVVTGQPVLAEPTEVVFAPVFSVHSTDEGSATVIASQNLEHATGDFYVKVEIDISGSAAITASTASIHRTAAGAGKPADVPFAALELDATTRALARTGDDARKGIFYRKIGTVHDVVGTSGVKFIEQTAYDNIDWSMTVLPEVESS